MYEATIVVDTRPTAAVPPRPDARLDAVLDLFCQALDEVNRLERRPVCSAIEYVMGQLRPNLDLMAVGCVDIDTLAALAAQRGLVRLARVGSEALVQREQTAGTWRAATSAPARYRKMIEGKLKCPLPSAEVRQRVFTETAAVLAEREEPDTPIALLDLSKRVERRMIPGISQCSVFKLLFALVLANAFIIARHHRLHRIGILAESAPIEQWDDLFVRACLNGLRRDRPVWPLQADLLAQTLDISTERLQNLSARGLT